MALEGGGIDTVVVVVLVVVLLLLSWGEVFVLDLLFNFLFEEVEGDFFLFDDLVDSSKSFGMDVGVSILIWSFF